MRYPTEDLSVLVRKVRIFFYFAPANEVRKANYHTYKRIYSLAAIMKKVY